MDQVLVLNGIQRVVVQSPRPAKFAGGVLWFLFESVFGA